MAQTRWLDGVGDGWGHPAVTRRGGAGGAMAVAGSRYAAPRPDTDAAGSEYRDEPPLHGDDAADFLFDGQGGRLGAEIFLGVGFVRQRRCPTGPSPRGAPGTFRKHHVRAAATKRGPPVRTIQSPKRGFFSHSTRKCLPAFRAKTFQQLAEIAFDKPFTAPLRSPPMQAVKPFCRLFG